MHVKIWWFACSFDTRESRSSLGSSSETRPNHVKFHHRKVSSLTLHSFARKFNGVLARKEFEKTRKKRLPKFLIYAWCLKITEKVSFHICELRLHLSWQKFTKNAKNGQFGEFLKTWTCSKTVLPDRSISIGRKLVESAKIEKLKCDILGDFQTLCQRLNRKVICNLFTKQVYFEYKRMREWNATPSASF